MARIHSSPYCLGFLLTQLLPLLKQLKETDSTVDEEHENRDSKHDYEKINAVVKK